MRAFWLMMPLLSFGAELEIRVIYDNTSAQPGIQEDWGYAALVDFRGHRILFDSGTKPDLFLTNLSKMQIDPASITQAMISHEHRDHRSGIYKLYPLHRRLTTHFLDRFPAEAFAEAGADFWLGEVPAGDDPVYVCAGCGDIVPLA